MPKRMKLGLYLAIMVIVLASLLFAIAFSLVENRRLKEELEKKNKPRTGDVAIYSEEMESELRNIYLLLAQQSSHMRLIMNTSLTKSHWATHTENNPQHECEECLRIYKEIHKQRSELEDMGLRKNPIEERLKGLGFKSILDSEGEIENGNE